MPTRSVKTRLIRLREQCVAIAKYVAAPETLAPLTPDEPSNLNGQRQPLWRFLAGRDELSSGLESRVGRRLGLFKSIFASEVLDTPDTETEVSTQSPGGLQWLMGREPLAEEEPEHSDPGAPGLLRHIFSHDSLSWELRPEVSRSFRLQWLSRREPLDTVEPSDSVLHREPSILKWILSREPFDAETGEGPQEAQSLMRWVCSREPLDGSKDGETPRSEA